MTVVREYLTSFMKECEYSEEATSALLDAYGLLSAQCGEELCALISEYEASYEIDYVAAIEKMKQLSEAAGIHEYTGALVLFLCYTRRMREYYREAGLSEELFRATVLDLKYKLEECRLVYGVIGTFVARWFPGFFKLSRFTLGRLQFEIIKLGAEFEGYGLKLTADSPVINVHIPRTGTRLDRDSQLDAYARAAEFYKDVFGEGPVVFACNSWLLFPRHKDMLKEGSNLKLFIDDYTLYDAGEYSDYKEIWRLFDKPYSEDLSTLPADSSLRRSYLELMRRGERTGWGKGLFRYKGSPV